MKTAGGTVTLYIPANMPATVEAIVKINKRAREDYTISTDFSLDILKRDKKDAKDEDWGKDIVKVVSATGKINGGGDPIKLFTVNGNIQIKKR